MDTHLNISGDNYLPSDALPRPTRLARRRPAAIATNLNSRVENQNETDPVIRAAMESDSRNYDKDRAYPATWLHLLRSTRHLRPKEYIDSEIVCTELLQFWWSRRYEATMGVVYLPFSIAHYASMLCLTTRVRRRDNTFEGMALDRRLSSVVPYVKHRRVCFFLHRNQGDIQEGATKTLSERSLNHFFPVVFDYRARKAHVFGALSGDGPKAYVQDETTSNWTAWLGPGLWERIGEWFDWHGLIGDPSTVTVVNKTWHQASRYELAHLELRKLNC